MLFTRNCWLSIRSYTLQKLPIILTSIQFMDPSQDQPHTLCPKCNNFILTSNFLIHQARCKGNNMQSSTYSRNSRVSTISNKNNGKHQNVVAEEERIPCPFCGYAQTLAQLDTHPVACPHRQIQCNLCHLKFPLSLMEQHQLVCTSRQRSSPSIAQEEPQNYQQPRPDRNRRSSNNRNRNYNHRIEEQRDQQEQMPPNLFRIIERSGNMENSPLNFFRVIERMQYESPFQRRERRMVVLDPGALIALLARRAGQGGQNGMTKEQIKQFPITKYHNPNKSMKKEDEDMCAICFCNFEEGEDCLNLPCKHKFHPECIGTWLEKNPTCPLCKKSFKQNSGRNEQIPMEMPLLFFNRINFH